jgi:hypothetical protein
LLALSLSWLWPLVAPAELELEEGWLLVLGELLEPAPAAPLGVLPEVALELLLGLDEAPPPALFFSSVLIDAEPEAAPEGAVLVVPEGEEVAPDEDAAPEGGVLVSRAVRPALLLSPQAARPKARETAAARMESFMCSPPWLG